MVRQGKAEIFSALDLKDAFHQIPVAESSRSITCTTTPRGGFQWRVVVMGWNNGSELVRYVKEKGLGDIPVLQNLSGTEGDRDMIEAAPRERARGSSVLE